MNREDIISMARETFIKRGFWPNEIMWECWKDAWIQGAAAEREKVAAWMIQRGYATGHGDTTEDLLKELDWQVLANWSSAMKTGAENEREACAKVCDALHYEVDAYGAQCAAAIRARGKT